MIVKEKVEVLREYMKERGIFAYVIPSADYHQSEYVGGFFKARHFISGFTGSAGTVVVTLTEAGLWTDGRYFIQADKQLDGTGIKLFKMGEPGVPTVIEYLIDNMPRGSKLGFDGGVVSAKEGREWASKLGELQVEIVCQEDLIDLVWKDRPALPQSKAFHLDVKYSGKSVADKLGQLREIMKKEGANVHVLTTLDDLAWLYNMRGSDIAYSPVILCYSIITMNQAILFVDEEKLSDQLKADFAANNVICKPYHAIYEEIKTLNTSDVILFDPAKVNFALDQLIPEQVKKVELANPTTLAKARKNSVEIHNIRKGHLKDGIAFTKFMYWLKTQINHMEITEISAAEKIEALRKEQEGYIEPSFATIAAYKEHAAMMHYSATPETNYTLEPGHLFLIDSGGQYYEGTTDITRTIALGEIDELLKKHFTAVVRGMINLSKAQFLQGVRGVNLDILARGPIWNLGIDYKCGTGHGVGYLLNVHEAPNGFRWRIVPERNDSCELEEGMLTTNEPGIYIEGSHGIRIENELIVKKLQENEYGQFLGFETVTFAPIDLDAIDPRQMNADEIDYLNNYHQEVYEKVAPYLTEEEREWLKHYTRAI